MFFTVHSRLVGRGLGIWVETCPIHDYYRHGPSQGLGLGIGVPRGYNNYYAVFGRMRSDRWNIYSAFVKVRNSGLNF